MGNSLAKFTLQEWSEESITRQSGFYLPLWPIGVSFEPVFVNSQAFELEFRSLPNPQLGSRADWPCGPAVTAGAISPPFGPDFRPVVIHNLRC
jgi:hypothetical protein